MHKHASSIALGFFIIVLLPGAIWMEKHEAPTWTRRLIDPTFEVEINRHTPINAKGTFLPPVINKNTHLTAQDNPIIIPASTTIAPGVELTITEGTTLFIHEYGGLEVKGVLNVAGKENKPVTFTTNEANPVNKVWSGITIAEGGQATITNARISYASPSITCQNNSRAEVNYSEISLGNTGLFSRSSACRITNSTIRSVRDGIVAIGFEPVTTNTTITASQEQITVIK